MGRRGQLAPRRNHRGRFRQRSGRGAAAWKGPVKRISKLLAMLPALLLALNGCGYHTAGKASHLPADVHVLAVPTFVNQTQVFKIEQIMTRDVVREFISRTRYQVTSESGGSADATLKGTVVSAQ